MKVSILLGLLFIACLSNSQTVTFHITSPFNDNEDITISEYDWVQGNNVIIHRQRFDSKGMAKFSLRVDKPRKFKLGNNEVFIEPERAVFLTIDSNFRITDTKAAHANNYTLYSQVNEIVAQNFSPTVNDFRIVKQNAQKLLGARMALAEKSLKKASISNQFFSFLKTELTSRHLQSLRHYYQSMKDSLAVPSSFLAEYSKQTLAQIRNLNSMWYCYALYDYAFDRATLSGGFSSSNFLTFLRSIEQNYAGEEREFLLTYLLNSYFKKQDQEYAEELLKNSKRITATLKNKDYVQAINARKEYYEKANRPIPNTILKTPLQLSDTLTNLGNILVGGKSNKVILFWASWCKPCIAEIQELGRSYPNFNSEGLDFVFISLDEDVSKCKAAAEKLKIKTSVLKKEPNAFIEFFSLMAIPKHILLENGLIKNLDFDLKTIL